MTTFRYGSETVCSPVCRSPQGCSVEEVLDGSYEDEVEEEMEEADSPSRGREPWRSAEELVVTTQDGETERLLRRLHGSLPRPVVLTKGRQDLACNIDVLRNVVVRVYDFMKINGMGPGAETLWFDEDTTDYLFSAIRSVWALKLQLPEEKFPWDRQQVIYQWLAYRKLSERVKKPAMRKIVEASEAELGYVW